MPFVNDENLDPTEEQKKKDEEAAPEAGSGSGVVSSGSGFEGAGSPSTPVGSGKPSSSGSWMNLDKYLNVNQEQAAKSGEDIAGSINQQGEQAQGSVKDAADEFTNQVNQNTVNSDEGIVSGAVKAAREAKAGSQIDPNLVSGYQKQANASYGGPTDFTASDKYGKAVNDVTNAQNTVNSTRSEAGRMGLLDTQYKNASQSGYNQGQKKLDQALLEGNQQARTALENTQDKWSGLNSILGNTTASENALANQAIGTDAATAQAARAALGTANQDFQGNVNQQYNDALKNYTAQQKLATGGLQSLDLTPEQAKSFGLSNGQRTYGINPGDYLDSGVTPTLANTATADQYAQAQALAQLAGLSQSDYLPSSNAALAGTASPSPFRTAQFNSAVSAAQANYENQQRKAYQQWLESNLRPIPGMTSALPVFGNAPVSEADWIAAQPYNLGTINATGKPREDVPGSVGFHGIGGSF